MRVATLRKEKMKKGDIVRIYKDPITELIVEGDAVLLKRVYDPSPNDDQEYWSVQFVIKDHLVGEKNVRGDIANRFILRNRPRE